MTQMTPISQEDLIFRHLELGGTITPLEALNLYGCFRLGARIWDLRQKGYNIQMKLVGDKKHYAQYKLAPKGDLFSNPIT